MLKNSLLILTTLILINKNYSQTQSNFYGSFESNGIYYQENEQENYANEFASNNYLNLKYLFNSSWNFEAQIESYSPMRLQGYSDSFEKTHLSTLSINYKKKGFGLTFGSIYEQFGSGLALRTWEDRQLGINNSIWGLRSTFENKNINLKLIGGWQKKGSQISIGKVIGLDSEITVFNSSEIYQNLILGFSYVGRFENLAFPDIFPPVGYEFDDLNFINGIYGPGYTYNSLIFSNNLTTLSFVICILHLINSFLLIKILDQFSLKKELNEKFIIYSISILFHMILFNI